VVFGFAASGFSLRKKKRKAVGGGLGLSLMIEVLTIGAEI